MNYCYHCMTKIDYDSAVFCPECGKKCSEHFAQSNELPAGTIIGGGRYLIGVSIGSGGFGITYVGRDLNINKKVLIKETFYNGIFHRNCYDTSVENNLAVTYDSNISFDKIMKKTRKECESLASAEELDNIVKVYDCFFENNTSYIITEFINGMTLNERVAKFGKYSWDEIYGKIKPLMASLSELHEMDILHRDIKPENIMIKSNKILGEKFILIDFGLARSTSNTVTLNMSVAFTPGYSPFEQRFSSGKDGTFIDVYSLAATIYFALTGEVPNQNMDESVDNNFPKLASLTLNYGVPEYVVKTMRDALNNNYKFRTQNINALIEGFENKVESDNFEKVSLNKSEIFDNRLGNISINSQYNTGANFVNPQNDNMKTGSNYNNSQNGIVNNFHSVNNMQNKTNSTTGRANNVSKQTTAKNNIANKDSIFKQITTEEKDNDYENKRLAFNNPNRMDWGEKVSQNALDSISITNKRRAYNSRNQNNRMNGNNSARQIDKGVSMGQRTTNEINDESNNYGETLLQYNTSNRISPSRLDKLPKSNELPEVEDNSLIVRLTSDSNNNYEVKRLKYDNPNRIDYGKKASQNAMRSARSFRNGVITNNENGNNSKKN